MKICSLPDPKVEIDVGQQRPPTLKSPPADNFILLEPRIARNQAYTTCIRTSPPSPASRRSSA